ncbi:MAG: lysophospholipid acyltransferase family protein [Gammaproteobacteria bacterium]|nr:lysophospholipid acyltransferase family protein [Gammaproteobacteria bacterium]
MDRLAPLVVVALTRLLSWLPLKWVRMLGGWFGALVWMTNGRPARITKVNLALCFPELSEPERARLGKRSVQETARLMTETGLIWHWSKERRLPTLAGISGEEFIKASLAEKRGILLLIPHFGNWEYLNLLLGKYPFTALYDPPRIRSLEAPMRRSRDRGGARLMRIDRVGLRAVYRALSEGEMVAILPDQVPDRSAGIHAPFFGVPALTMTFAHRLIKKTHPLVLMASVTRVDLGFEVCFSKLSEDIYSDDVTRSVAAMNQAIEDLVRRDLAQYQWEYKRFKKQPLGVDKVYPKELATPVARGEEDD